METVKIANKYALDVNEASEYFNINSQKIARMARINPRAPYFLRNGNKLLVKRVIFEKFLDGENNI